MKLLLSVVLVALVGAVLAVPRPDEKYTTKYDNVNVDDIIKNERLLLSYYNCLMEKGKCSPDGVELKKSIPDALKTDCTKCSEKQKEMTEKVLKHLIEKKKDLWTDLAKKYDPEGVYEAKYKKMAEEKGIKL